jgi:hypothetical protein
VSPLFTPVFGVENAPPLMEMPAQPGPQVAVTFVKPPASVTVLLVMELFVATPVWSMKLKALTEPPAPVVTCQVPLTVGAPTLVASDTVAVVAVEALAEEVCRMAIVSPALMPVTGPALNAPPLMDMPVQPALQVAVAFEKPAASVTALLVMAELNATPVWFVKENGWGATFVWIVHVPLVVVPTVTLVFDAVRVLAEDICWMAMVLPLFTPVTGPATNAPPLMDMPVQPALQVAVMFVKPPASVTVLLVMVELNATPPCPVKLKALTVPPLVPVVTCHGELVVGPTVTVAVVAVLTLAEEVCWIAMVLPLLAVVGPAVNAPPLMDMPVHPAPQVTVWPAKAPDSVTVLLVMVELVAWLVTLVKLKALTCGPVVMLQLPVVLPTVTLAVVPVIPVGDEVDCMAMVSPVVKPATGPATNAPPLREIAEQPAPQVAVAPVKAPASVTVLLVWRLETGALVVAVKENGLTVPPFVVTVQTALVVAPTVTVAVVAVAGLAEEVC